MTCKELRQEYRVNSQEWYVEENQANAYLALMNKSYGSRMVAGEDALLRDSLPVFDSMLPARFTYIDLGPGNASKSELLISGLKKRHALDYLGIDIQERFLDIAREKIGRQGINIETEVSSFEDFLASPNTKSPAFLYLGATYGNFKSEDICRRLNNYMTRKDIVYLSCATLPTDKNSMVQMYKDTLHIFAPIAKKQGIRTFQPHAVFNRNTNCIEQGFIDNEVFYVYGISKKPSREQFEKELFPYFTGEFMQNSVHMGFLGRKR